MGRLRKILGVLQSTENLRNDAIRSSLNQEETLGFIGEVSFLGLGVIGG